MTGQIKKPEVQGLVSHLGVLKRPYIGSYRLEVDLVLQTNNETVHGGTGLVHTRPAPETWRHILI